MHYTEDELILHHYGELGASRGQGAAEHLARCTSCRASYAGLQQVLSAVDASPLPDPPEGFERIAWARLQPVLGTARRGWLPSFTRSPSRLGWVGAIIVLVIGAFLAGRLSQPPSPPPAAQAAETDIRERLLMSDMGEHLDRSQAMLVEVISTEGGRLAAERERAQELLSDNRLYRQTAAATGHAALVTVLDDLEKVLVDIATGPDVVSSADAEHVRQQIETDGLLFKVRVLAREVRDQQKAAIRLRTSQSS